MRTGTTSQLRPQSFAGNYSLPSVGGFSVKMEGMTSLLLAATLGGGRPNQSSHSLEMPAFFNCGTKGVEREEKFINAPPPKQGPLFLRMCVLCGNDLAAGDTSVL